MLLLIQALKRIGVGTSLVGRYMRFVATQPFLMSYYLSLIGELHHAFDSNPPS